MTRGAAGSCKNPEAAWARKVRGLMAARKLTQSELARELGVAVTTVNWWANGRTDPSREAREKIEAMLEGEPKNVVELRAARPENMHAESAERIRSLREDELGVGVNEFASLVGVKGNHVRKWERGECEPTKPDILERLERIEREVRGEPEPEGDTVQSESAPEWLIEEARRAAVEAVDAKNTVEIVMPGMAAMAETLEKLVDRVAALIRTVDMKHELESRMKLLENDVDRLEKDLEQRFAALNRRIGKLEA